MNVENSAEHTIEANPAASTTTDRATSASLTLTGHHITLEPLSFDHCDALEFAVADGALWELWYTNIPRPENMEHDIARRLNAQAERTMLPFAVRRNDTGALCGMTTYLNIDAKHRRLEIGATWYAKSAQRTAINTEAKYLLLRHAFEEFGCIAVEFRTHYLNHTAREAILRLGAKQDGILRNHQILPDGTLRDTVVFSILASEWPSVRQHLQYRLGRGG